jgi:hypothetical protein
MEPEQQACNWQGKSALQTFGKHCWHCWHSSAATIHGVDIQTNYNFGGHQHAKLRLNTARLLLRAT